MTFFSRISLALACLLSTELAEASDKDFLAAREAYQQGNLALLAEYGNKLQDDNLKIYADYYLLSKQLAVLPTDALQSFFQQYKGSWLAEKLRSEWLKVVAKRGDWPTFQQYYGELVDPDNDLKCYAYQARAINGDKNALTEAKDSLWLNGRFLGEACEGVLNQAQEAKLMNEDDYWQRLRLALQANNHGLARSVAGKLGIDLSPTLLQKIDSAPKQYLAKPDVATAIGHELYLMALGQASNQDLSLTATYWQSVVEKFAKNDKAYGWRLLAIAATKRQDPRAVSWFKASNDTLWLDSDREWQARAAIRFENWPELITTIESMTPSKQQERCWRYWRAHALQKLGQKETVYKAVYGGLAVDDDYYGLLARDHLGEKVTATPPAYEPTAEDLQRLANNDSLQRAIRLFLLDLRTEAVREWSWGLRNADDKLLLTAAEQAANVRWYDRAIYAAERTKQLHRYSLRYLAPYKEVAQGYAQEVGLDPAWVYGLMRQESRFITNARSGVGAGGLMQLMPTTAQWVANRLKIRYHATMVNDVGMNVRLGTYYLKTILSNLGNQPVLATAGYNAGPNRAKQWQDDNRRLEADIYVESIPFLETRDYVKKVMTNAVHYAVSFGQGPQSLQARMGQIPARNNAPITSP